MDSVLDSLNAAQRTAVTSSANVLQVLAPPGSGKTKTLTSRVAYLLQHHDYKPWNVICLTFTIKSSKEMKERISKLVGQGSEKKLILGTFHSVCRRYLVTYGHLIGLRKDFAIADSSDQISIIKRIHKRLGLNIDPKVAQSRISKTKSRGLSYHDLAHELRSKKDVEQQEIVTLFEEYEAHLAMSNMLDYDDLLLRSVYLLRTHPSCVSNVELVVVDEFQDTNAVQFDLLRLFAIHKNRITTVGDPDQSIYGWRSAEVKNLKKMQKQYRDTLVIRLEDNYRSSGAILLAAQEVIEQDESRPQKSILPTHCPGTVPVLRKLPSATVEADWTVTEIKRTISLTGHLLEYSDFAILLRSAALSRLVESAMSKAGVPYRMVGGNKFFDRVEVKILLDYLRIVNQPSNNDALVRIINIPTRGIGAATVKGLLEEAETQNHSLWELIRNILTGHRPTKTKISKIAVQGLSALVNIVLTARTKLLDSSHTASPEDLLRHIIRKTDFPAYIEKSYAEDHEARWANVEELLAQASEYRIGSLESMSNGERDDDLPQVNDVEQAISGGGQDALSRFLANVALAAAVDVAKEEASDGNQAQSQVTISTIHAAKGLEWPVVFIPSAYEGSIPHSRAEDTDEERRLLYVAMTRAQALLYMSYPVKNSQREETKLSPFLSTKKVGRSVANQGPVINVPAVVDIARILKRGCPSGNEIEGWSRDLESTRDDLWPLTGEESLTETQDRRSKWDDLGSTDRGRYPSKKRRLNKESSDPIGSCVVSRTTTFIGSSTTMDNAAAFSYNGNTGFSTAAAQLQLAREVKSTLQKSTLPKHNVKRTADRAQQRLKEGATLLDMWCIENKAGAQSKNLHLPDLAQGEHRAACSSIISPHQSQERGPRTALATIPQDLIAHRLNPIIKQPPPSEYVLLSSSPLEPERNAEPVVQAMEHSAEELTSIAKPAQAMPTSKVSHMQRSSNLPPKTLGVRRNVTSWSARPSNSFKAPKMVPKKS